MAYRLLPLAIRIWRKHGRLRAALTEFRAYLKTKYPNFSVGKKNLFGPATRVKQLGLAR
jgi:hypothetical protein